MGVWPGKNEELTMKHENNIEYTVRYNTINYIYVCYYIIL